MTEKIGRNIALQRVERGVTQQQLSKLVGISREHLNRIENGHHSVSFEVAIRIAQELRCTLKKLAE